MQVQNVLKKLAKIEVNTICPLHGPVLSENLNYYLDLSDKFLHRFLNNVYSCSGILTTCCLLF